MSEIRPPLTPEETQNIIARVSQKDRLRTAATIAAGVCNAADLKGCNPLTIAEYAVAIADELIAEVIRTAPPRPVRMDASQIITELNRPKL